MTIPPFVSVIVVNWNGKETLQKCLESLFNQSYSSIEIIVVDNHSEDGSYESTRSIYGEKIKWIRNSKNEGFARGNNIGILASRGEYILLLNNDAWAEPDWVRNLVESASFNDKTGMVASRIYLGDQEEIIDNTGHLVYPDGISWGRGRMQRDTGQFDQETEVIFPSGCAALYKKQMLDEIGYFDERFFAYCEDTDLGFRARLAGWQCRYSPRAVVHHYFSKSSSETSSFKAFQVERNRRWVIMKNYPWPYLILSPWYSIKRYLWQGYGILKGKGMASQFSQRNSLISGWMILIRSFYCAWVMFPVMRKERFRIQVKRKISSKEFGQLLNRFGVGVRTIAFGEQE